jgi:hypothetical protein
MLYKYANYLTQSPDSFLSRLYGLFKVGYTEGGVKVRGVFLVMSNVFPNLEEKPDVVFDIKGSLVNRIRKESGPLKEQDWLQKQYKLLLCNELYQTTMEQLSSDISVMRQLMLWKMVLFTPKSVSRPGADIRLQYLAGMDKRQDVRIKKMMWSKV